MPLLTKGDTVVVIRGDLTDLMGKVLRVRQVRQPIACSLHTCVCACRINFGTNLCKMASVGF